MRSHLMKKTIRARRRNRRKARKAEVAPFIFDTGAFKKIFQDAFALIQQTLSEVARYHSITGAENLRRSQAAIDSESWNVGNFAVKENLGDSSCEFNARSPYLQCVINPTGDCSDCEDREDLRINAATKEAAQAVGRRYLEATRSPAAQSIRFQGVNYTAEGSTEVFRPRSQYNPPADLLSDDTLL